MTFTREDVRASVERAGDEHWRALIANHEDAYPASPPTPGDVCRFEAERLIALGVGDASAYDLLETRVTRVGSTVELTHHVRRRADGAAWWTEPFRGYGP